MGRAPLLSSRGTFGPSGPIAPGRASLWLVIYYLYHHSLDTKDAIRLFFFNKKDTKKFSVLFLNIIIRVNYYYFLETKDTEETVIIKSNN
jgi:hypothetical protein